MKQVLTSKKIKTLSILIVLFQFFITLYASEENYLFLHIDTQDGLASNKVFSFHKDQKGFMWVGTSHGLSRFDGNGFKNFNRNPEDSTSLQEDIIMNITEDLKGRLWINANKTISIYDSHKESFIPRSSPIFNNLPKSIVDIHNDKFGNIWFTSKEGIFRYSSITDSISFFEHFGDEERTPSYMAISIKSDTLGYIYATLSNGSVVIVNGENLRVLYKKEISLLEGEKSVLFIDNDQDIWFYNYGGTEGIWHFSNPLYHNQKFNLSRIKTNIDIITSICEDHDNNIWIGTDHGGINIYNKLSHEMSVVVNDPLDNRSLGQNALTSLFCDDEGIIWAGTFKKGLSYYHKSMFKFKKFHINFKDVHSASINDIDNAVEDKYGNLWMGTNGAGLIYFDRKKKSFKQYRNVPGDPNSLSADIIIGMLYDSKDRLWIGTYFGGLNYYTGNRFIQYRHKDGDNKTISDDRVWDIFEDSKNRLWISTLLGGVDIFDPEKKVVIRNLYQAPDSSKLRTNNMFSVIESRSGDFWLASANGLAKYNYEKDSYLWYGAKEPDPYKISDGVIYEVIEDSRGLIWACTNIGLNIIDPVKNITKTLGVKDGIPSSLIVSIREDNNHNMWIGSDYGLAKIKTDHIDDPLKSKYYIETFSLEDGLQSHEFNHKSSAKLKSGELFFGGRNGFNIIDDFTLKTVLQKQSPAITGIEIFNQPVEISEPDNDEGILFKTILETGSIELPYNKNNINLEFSALCYFHPNKIKYKYILEPFEKEWNETNALNRKATYTNLEPREYTFKVMASDIDGNWIEKTDELKIVVRSPWYYTLWMKIFYIMAITGIITGFYFVYLRSINKRRLELEKLVKKRTLELENNFRKLEEQKDKVSAINKILEERQYFIEEQTNKLNVQKQELENINSHLNETNALLEERQQFIEEQSEELRTQKEELMEANEHLKELNSMKNKFFSIIAHDLKNPLSIVLGFTELLNFNINKLTDKKKDLYVNKIYKSARNINNLLENLLQWARSQTDNLIFEPLTINLKNVVIQSISLLNENIKNKNIHVENENTEYYNVYADLNMTNTIVRNIISNAVKFTPNGGKINITCKKEGDYVCLSVQDNGIGIEKKDIEKLFRIDSNFTREGTEGETGTGLGLILCKEFVTRNGGDIKVESTTDGGSVFHVLLPHSDYIYKNNKGFFSTKSIMNQYDKNLLVVEDEPTNFYLIQKFLKNINAHIYWAKNGREAINMVIQKDKYNLGLVIMNLMMPVMDGLEAIKIIRSIDNDIPVIAQSAFLDEISTKEGYSIGFTEILHKPINRETLLNYVEKFL